ncbi:LBL_2463 family protein [Leptospira stimsonii]|uniref:GNAT family N-acetyltransferase n=1 Tax=Leptospira stimsonii TaxID=2202203 RepID=A0A4R9L9D5_9LEPT|nr:hypothetical protein [Leptospira stimsonii]RHX83193.1 hypothetical protein DLM78_22990 [Leptospira stimsonii]TGK26885.1 hypothetical protein EHO98_00065 [Leptospira stimsonii]TGM17324.1 hypothetical protein EHQ90_07565 [Leptospira stimsonii]
MSHSFSTIKPVHHTNRSERFQFHTWNSSQDLELLNPVRAFSQSVYREAGYSEYKTVNLDRWSTWFFATYEGEIQAATRIVEKTTENKIPLEIAQIHPSGNHYSVSNLNVADWNSVSFRQTILGAQAFTHITRLVARFCLDKNFDLVYGMINPTWKGLERVYYDNGAIPSEEYPSLVCYPGCFLKGQFALFRLIEIRKNALRNMASKL